MKTGGKCIMRRKLKRIAGITLCAGMIYQGNNFIMSSTVYADEMQYSVGNSTYSYVIEDDGTVTLTRYSGTDTDIVIPKSIDGKMVTSIGDSAFSRCSDLTSITISEGVTNIGNYAFYECNGLTSISIPEGVTSIGNYAFSGCSGLTSISIPEGVTSIGYSAFSGCSGLTSISIPEGVTSIGYSAFYNCSGLTSINIPNSVTSIGYRAFSGCSGLTSIKVDSNNKKYDSRNNCNAIIDKETNTLIAGCKNTIIPEGVTSIGACAFYNCSGLTSINIPNSVTSIGGSAFEGCSGLTSISIPEGVTSIGWFAFSLCDNLTIYGTAGSYVETYAKEESIPFVIIQSACNYGEKLAGYEVADLNKEACDVNGDGKVTSVDAVLLLKYVAGYDVELGK